MPSLTVIEPSKMIAGSNPVVLTLSTANNATPANAKNVFTINNLLHNNDQLQITLSSDLNGYTAKFYARDFPNADNYFLTGKVLNSTGGTVIGTTTKNQIASSLAQCLQSDLIINKNYYVNSSGVTVTLISKEQSGSYAITSNQAKAYSPAGTLTATGISMTVVSTGSSKYSGSLVKDYALYADLYLDKFSGYTWNQSNIVTTNLQRVAGLELPYSTDNVHQFDFSNILSAYVSLSKPDFGSIFTVNNSYLRPFFITYGENYPLVAGTFTKKKNEKGRTGIKWVLDASLDYLSANTMTVYSGQTVGGKLANVKWLTNSPVQKRTHRQAREPLYILIPKNAGQIVWGYGDFKFWDGSTTTKQFLYGYINTTFSNAGGLYLINADYFTLGLSSLETANKKIKQFDFYLGYTGNTNYSEKKTFLFDNTETTPRFGVAFKNKLGTFDTFDFRGYSETTINRSATNFTTPLEINSDGSLSKGYTSTASNNVQAVKKISVDSGWISQKEFDWLLELMSSNYIYSYSTNIDNSLRIDSFKYSKSNQDNQYFLECVFLQTLYENNVGV